MSALLFEDKLWLNLFFAVEWAVRLAMIVVVPMRRSPDAAKGWLLLIFFEPTVGLILYALIGRPTLPQWRQQRHVEFEALSRPSSLTFQLAPLDPTGGPLFCAVHEVRLARRRQGTRLALIIHVSDVKAQGAPAVAGIAFGWEQTLDKLEAELRRH